jgi:hypothetical protein
MQKMKNKIIKFRIINKFFEVGKFPGDINDVIAPFTCSLAKNNIPKI